jgi:CubicO group peptidase (beta-lactamase class C family)
MTAARKTLTVALLGSLVFVSASSRPADDLDRFIQLQMARRQIPGLSLAIIQNSKILEARGYGVIEKGGTAPVTPTTLFQAGSISKSVAAAAALHLVEEGRLSLDGNVNAILTSWKLPENAFTANTPVTLRRILSHTAGLTVHGFPGYAASAPAATLVQVLDGTSPANTAAIRVDTFPGSIWRYSGGGYTVMQQMIVDLTHRPFPDFMRETVLEPFGMRSSTYEQPLPPEKAALTATGHYEDRSLVKGRWHVYPEMAAAGLWTTPSDLARFAIGIQRTLAGGSHAVMSAAMARQMVTDQMNGDGLGVFLQNGGRSLFFGHNGRDEGFDALMTASAETGQGLVLMINANDDSRLAQRIQQFIARKYHWPDSVPPPPTVLRAASVTSPMLLPAAGRYEFHNNDMLALVSNDTALSTLTGGLPDEEFLPQGGDVFASSERKAGFVLVRDAGGTVTGLRWTQGGKERTIPRIGPLIEALQRQPDPDPGLTDKILSTLTAIMRGGDAVKQAPYLTAGARRDFDRGAGAPLAGMRELSFIAGENVAGRGIERHGGQVARIAYYALTTGTGKRYVMVHLTPDNMVTDFDLVDN